MLQTNEIKQIVYDMGADLCGIASIDCFDEAPEGFHPCDIYADCKSVISFAIALPKGLSKVNPRLIYGHYNYISCSEIDMIGFKSAKKIEKNWDCIAVSIPCDSPYEYWNHEKMEGRGLLSMRHIAVQAGLGSLGKSSLLINNHYGNMITLGAILTNLEVSSDAPSERVCIANCHKCIEACPVNALENGIVNQKLCRKHTYGKNERGFDTVNCNKCRTVCPRNYASPIDE